MDDKLQTVTNKDQDKKYLKSKSKKLDKIVLPVAKAYLFTLPQRSCIIQNARNGDNLTIDTFSQKKRNQKSINLNQAFSYNKKKHNLCLVNDKAIERSKKELNKILSPLYKQELSTEFRKVNVIEPNLAEPYSLKLQKRDSLIYNALKSKDEREKKRNILDTYLDQQLIINPPDKLSYTRSRSTFYPNKNWQFKTLNVFQQTIRASKGGSYSKCYPRKKNNQASQLEITKANFSPRNKDKKNDLKELSKQLFSISWRKSPPVSTSFKTKPAISKKQFQDRKSQSQIKGWDTIDD